MTSRVIETSGSQFFVTSDNPAVYVRCEDYGPGGKEAHFRLPYRPKWRFMDHGTGAISVLLASLFSRRSSENSTSGLWIKLAASYLPMTTRPGLPGCSRRVSWVRCGLDGEFGRLDGLAVNGRIQCWPVVRWTQRRELRFTAILQCTWFGEQGSGPVRGITPPGPSQMRTCPLGHTGSQVMSSPWSDTLSGSQPALGAGIVPAVGKTDP